MNRGESPYRVPTSYLWIAVVACLMAVLVACGGGGAGVTGMAGVGSGGTGATFSGPITGFGSIIVNGVRIDDSSASITLDDDRSGADGDLKLGMMVDVEAETDAGGTTARASRIATRSFLHGPVAAIDVGANRLEVLGVSVAVTSRTVFDGAGLDGLAALRVNDMVEIHGIADQAGGVKASRIERMPASQEVRLTGKVEPGAGASTFRIRDVTVQYQPGDLLNAPNGISAGMLVQVKGTLTGNTIDAGSIRVVQPAPPVKNQQRVEVKGVVTSFASADAFEVNGLPVRVGAGAKVEGAVAAGAHVEVEGRMENDVLVVSKVEVEDDSRKDKEEEAVELHGPIASVDAAAGTFLMRRGNVTVKWDSSTRFGNGLSGASLAPGMTVEVKGKVRGNMVVASRVEIDG